METTIQDDSANIKTSKSLKSTKIIYWISTGILALFLLSGAFFINSKMAIDAMHHPGVPEGFDGS